MRQRNWFIVIWKLVFVTLSILDGFSVFVWLNFCVGGIDNLVQLSWLLVHFLTGCIFPLYIIIALYQT